MLRAARNSSIALFKLRAFYVCQALYIELAAEDLLVGVEASNQAADHGERRNRANPRNDQNERSRARNLGGVHFIYLVPRYHLRNNDERRCAQ